MGTIGNALVQGDAGATSFDNGGTIDVGSVVDLGAGSDSVTQIGDLQGLLTYGLGDDTHVQTSNDTFSGVLSGGAGNDTLELGDAGEVGTIDGGNYVEFESLTQSGGSWQLTGTQTYTNGIEITGGTLPAGATAHVMLGSGSTINADISESTAGAGGSQILALEGTTLNGDADLGAGDDEFQLIGNSIINGTLDGGAGDNDQITLTGSGVLSSPVVNVEIAESRGNWTTAAGTDYTLRAVWTCLLAR